jgi:hypothetical protein
MNRISHEQLLAEFSYDPESGIFCRLVRAGRIQPGPIENVATGTGYVYLAIHNRKYLAHRLAWFYMIGRWPVEIDHINGNKIDNRFRNLRPATRAQNEGNKFLRKDSSSGVKGVRWDDTKEMWYAYITTNGVMKNLGYHKEMANAIAARQRAALARDGEFFRAA